MILYLVRHGKAQQSSPTGRDADRPLEPRGERQAARLGEHIANQGSNPAPALILASGFVRAAETARLIHERVGGERRHEPALEVGWPAQSVLEMVEGVRAAGEAGPIMLVGHNPQMEILVSLLTSGAVGGDLEMRPGMAAVFEFDPGVNADRGSSLLEILHFDV